MKQKIPVLKITCGTTDCDNGHHAFNDPNHEYKRRDKDRKFLQPGVCKACGVAPISWTAIHKRSTRDLDATIDALQLEWIRWRFWTVDFNSKTLENLAATSRVDLLAEIRPMLVRIVGPIGVGGYSFKQVPTDPEKLTSALQYAMHAVAACCRKCTALWHGIPNDHQLTDKEIDYLALLVGEFVERRLPVGTFPDEVDQAHANQD
jgi:Domain of unknown function (DUF4186)